MTDPRLLLLDFTAIPGPAATSTLKAAYFDDWRDDALLHIMDLGADHLGLAASPDYAPRAVPRDALPAHKLTEAFRPQIILYRPVADSLMFHRYSMEAIEAGLAQGAGLALWMMDDWPERLKTSDPALYAEMDRDLRALFANSAVNFAISEGMARIFGDRYGVPFAVAHNGVDPADWPAVDRAEKDYVVVRYAGSLAPDTTKDSVAAVAKAVSNLARRGAPIRLEGRTHKSWMAAYGKPLNALKGVAFARSNFDETAYRRWLSEADILLIAYNFDEATRTYLKYSFANKVPETMAAGAAILAYGPGDIETLGFLQQSGAALMVTRPDAAALEDALASLAADKDKRRALGAAARDYAFVHFDLKTMKTAFRKMLADAGSPPGELAGLGARAAIYETAGPPQPRSAYRKFADALHDRAPGVAKLIQPFAQRLLKIARSAKGK